MKAVCFAFIPEYPYFNPQPHVGHGRRPQANVMWRGTSQRSICKPMELITAKQMQEIDRRAIDKVGIPGRVLMESAGRGCVSALYTLTQGRPLNRVTLVCGVGNNGGDGFVVARYLVERGIGVMVYLLGKASYLTGEALENYQLLSPLAVDVVEILDTEYLESVKRTLGESDLIVDALFGTGLARNVGGVFARVVSAMNQSEAPILSVDIPSGICADTGRVMGCAVEASATATFCRPKPGHVLYPGRSHVGDLSIVDIGIPERVVGRVRSRAAVITSASVMERMRAIADDGHKGSRGHLALVAGSTGKSGAAILCASAAVASGAGLVSAAIPETINTAFESRCLEAMSQPFSADEEGGFASGCDLDLAEFVAAKEAVAVGPGLGTGEGAFSALKCAIDFSSLPLVLDADALNILAGHPELLEKVRGRAIVTPHPMEFSRLSGLSVPKIQRDRMGAATAYAQKTGLHVVLKGAGTVVAHPDGWVGVNPTGDALLATGGTGDVLTGVVGALLAQGYSLRDAAEIGVYLHGEAANRISEKGLSLGMPASALIDELSGVLSDALAQSLLPRMPETFCM